MGLIQNLINLTLDDSVRVANLLRHAKVLAYRLDSKDLGAWVSSELDGYKREEGVPEYRIFTPLNFGNFSGPFGAAIRNARIPMALTPEYARDRYGTYHATQAIQVYEDYFADPNNTDMSFAWDQNVIAILQHETTIYEGYVIAEARQSIAKPHFVGIFDTVRNRLLELLLELQKNYPEMSDSDQGLKQIPSERVSSLIQMTVYGGQQNFASGTHFSQTATQIVNQGDFDKLRERLLELDVAEEDISQLQEAIRHDELAEGKGKMGTRVRQWIGTVSANAAGGIGTATLLNLPSIIGAVQQFFGAS